MDYSTYFSLNKPRLLCYGVGSLFAVQSVQSAYIGLKKIVHTIHGSTPYNERITGVAESQIAVLKQSRDVCIGCDTVKERLTHLKEALKSFSFAAVEALVATILFFKGAHSSTDEVSIPSPETQAKLQKFDEQFMETFFNSSEVSHHMQKISCFTSFYNQGGRGFTACEQNNLFEQLNKPFEIIKLTPSQKDNLLGCVKKLAFYKMMRSDYMSLSPELALLQGVDTQKMNALATIFKDDKESKEGAISLNFNVKTASSALQALDAYADYLKNNAELYVKIHKERFDNYTKSNMTRNFGPITAHIDKMCDSGLFKELYLQSDTFCNEYFDLKSKYLEANKRKRAIFKNLKSGVEDLNCKQVVFDPALKDPILKKLLTAPQYQSLQDLLAWDKENLGEIST